MVCRVANSTLDHITNCPIVFATTIECAPATGVQFNALHIDLLYILFVIIIYLNTYSIIMI